MRFAIAVLMTCGLLLGSAAIPTVAVASAAGHELTVADQQQPSGKIEVDINTHRGGGAWYTSPVWIAIGVLALVLLVVLIVMATRGGGTTIVRE